MVTAGIRKLLNPMDLSVLALSSRFDGRKRKDNPTKKQELSVLALSSRFDGHPVQMAL